MHRPDSVWLRRCCSLKTPSAWRALAFLMLSLLTFSLSLCSLSSLSFSLPSLHPRRSVHRVSNLRAQWCKWLEHSASNGAASRALLRAASAGRDRNSLHLRSQPWGSVAAALPMRALWGLSGFASSSHWVRPGRNKAKCLANHPRCQGPSLLRAEARAVCFLGSRCAVAPVKVSAGAGAGGAGRPGASWRAAAPGSGARPRPPGLHWIRLGRKGHIS